MILTSSQRSIRNIKIHSQPRFLLGSKQESYPIKIRQDSKLYSYQNLIFLGIGVGPIQIFNNFLRPFKPCIEFLLWALDPGRLAREFPQYFSKYGC
jgi:hypothetical protein